jgi:predicted nuclease with TOPRIM domain
MKDNESLEKQLMESKAHEKRLNEELNSLTKQHSLTMEQLSTISKNYEELKSQSNELQLSNRSLQT